VLESLVTTHTWGDEVEGGKEGAGRRERWEMAVHRGVGDQVRAGCSHNEAGQGRRHVYVLGDMQDRAQ
jgi:hypothetical protein